MFSFGLYGQSWQWGKRGGGNGVSGSTYEEDVRAIETDSQGNVYILSPLSPGSVDVDGNPQPSYGFDDNVIASFTCNGTYRWSTVIGGPLDDYIQNMQVDANGDVYVIGRPSYGDQFDPLFHFDVTTTLPYSTVNRKRIYIAKYSGATGNLLWYRFPQADGLTNTDYGQSGFYDFDLSADGTSYILAKLKDGIYADGQFTNTTVGLTYFLLQYNALGDFVSAMPLDMSVSQLASQRKICNIKKHPVNGNFYFAGNKYSNDASFTIGGQTFTNPYYVACFSATGQFLWVKTVTTDGSTGGRGLYDFAIDLDGYLYITGICEDGDTYDTYTVQSGSVHAKPYLFKLNTDGTLVWGSNGVTVGSVGGRALAINGNEIAVSPDVHMLNWSGGSYPVVPNGGADASIFRFDKVTGAYIDKTKLSSTNGISETIGYMTTDVFGNYVVGGRFANNITINGSTILNNDGSETDFFVAKFGTSNCTLGAEEIIKASLEVYPNPTTEMLYVSIKEPMHYVIYNLLGMKIEEGQLGDEGSGIAIKTLAEGHYVLQLTNNEGVKQVLRFVKE
ncbi:MAG: T9SS type A sorting domain-containing protein [Flavobacterium sp.]